MSSNVAHSQNRMVRFQIKRQDAPGQDSYWEEFELPYKPDANVISCLQAIAASPVTVQGREVTPVVWDSNCLEEVCGACTMVINGVARQACSALLHNLVEQTGKDVVLLEPMTKFPVVRDLWVDRSRMFGALTQINGWVPIDGTMDLGPGPKESPQQQDMRYSLSRCMTCGCCLEACPEFGPDRAFIGPQAIGQVHYFNLHPVGKVTQGERLDSVMGPGGVTDCGNAQNCVKVCPKEVPLTTAIAAVGRQATVHAIKQFFSGK